MSSSGPISKALWMAIIGLLVASAILWLREEWAAKPERNAAYARLREAAKELNDDAARAAVARFKAAGPWFGKDPRLDDVNHAERDIPTWANLRKRNEAYASLRKAIDQSDEAAAATAVKAFLDHGPTDTDPRSDQVAKIAGELRSRASRRLRDAACSELLQAEKAADNLAILAAAEKFLEASEPGIKDNRSEYVRKLYSKAFSGYVIANANNQDATVQAKIDRYRKLIPIE